MKAWIDKILLGIGVLALVSGIAFWLLQADNLPPARVELSVAAHAAPVEPVPVPEVETVEADWDAARPQDEAGLQLYQVFTPPKIYVNANGAFDFIPPQEPKPPQPFGLRLLAVERELYRIQYEGFIEDPADPSNSLILLYNTDSGNSLRVQKGQTLPEAQIEILDFTVIREIQEDGLLYKEEKTRIRDNRLDAVLTLSSQEPNLYTDERTIRVEDTLAGGGTAELKAIGDTVTFGDRTYTLEAFDPVAGTATFTKTGPEVDEPIRRQRVVRTVPPEPEEASEGEGTDDAEGSTSGESSDDFPF
ncbi:MAG: hypothetical protein ACFE0O_09405 [Opitutales bacterium]